MVAHFSWLECLLYTITAASIFDREQLGVERREIHGFVVCDNCNMVRFHNPASNILLDPKKAF